MDMRFCLPQDPCPAVSSMIACTVVKHILYSRRQCGMLIESLKNVLEEEAITSRANPLAEDVRAGSTSAVSPISRGKRRKMQQFLQSTEEVLAALGPALFQQCRPLKVVVVLGAAVSRPLEAYELQYRQHADTVASENRNMEALRMKLRRALLAGEASNTKEGRASSSATKTTVLLALPPGSPTPAGFLPKRGLHMNLRRSVCNAIAVEAPPRSREAGLSEDFSRLLHAASESQEIWFQSCIQIKGIPQEMS